MGVVFTSNSINSWGECPVCKQHAFLVWHRCPPQWECRQTFDLDPAALAPGDDEDWQIVYAVSEDRAAENFAAEYDAEVSEMHDYRFVLVRAPGSSNVQVFAVSCEMVPSYSARRDYHLEKKLEGE